MVKKLKIKPRVFFLKLLKCLLIPITRIRKLTKKFTMTQLRIAVAMLGLASCLGTLLLYYCNRPSLEQRRHKSLHLESTTTEKYLEGHPMIHVPLNELYRDIKSGNDSFEIEEIDDNMQAYMVNTVGCRIPVAMVDYEKYLTKNRNRRSCGSRAVFLSKNDADRVQVYIKDRMMKQHLRKGTVFDCCCRFLLISKPFGFENQKNKYTACKKIHNLDFITLESDFVNVKCFEYDERNITRAVYDDYYAFTKKINNVKRSQKTDSVKYNVLMVGMDSMSLPRVAKTMPRTIWHFKENYWLGFRGYHKVDDNTFPNLMAALTGKNVSMILNQCSGKMDQCQDMFIWNKFKEDEYVTAYGEDYLRLPDTFTNKYAFQEPPTDHYLRPFFINREIELNNKSLVCAGKVTSGQQLLNYALDFANTYKRETFFGLFWMNSFSHNVNSRPQDGDKMFENFFNQLSYTGALANTFVIFFSDHGLRFGEHLWKWESHYDNRMPVLFMWVPTIFKGKHPVQFSSLVKNQFRLVTPYDLFNTLMDIKRVSAFSNSTDPVSEACVQCQSMFDTVSGDRTCNDVTIHEKWCSCHHLHPLFQDTDGAKSVATVVSYINSMITSVETKRCWGCLRVSLNKILRMHFYYNNDKDGVYYVVAFTITPGNVSYEATVLRKGEKMDIIGPVSAISAYRSLGKCTIKPNDRLFCVCQKHENC